MRSTAKKGVGAAIVVAAVASAAALVLGSLSDATAGTNAGANPDSSLMDQTDNHTMGSQVRKHEGGTPVSDTRDLRVDHRPNAAAAVVYGIDVASYQGNVNWSSQYSAGKRFAYVKATEGNSYTNPYFAQQYNGSYNVGMIRGAYHFARPDGASGGDQARYFVAHGGGWSADGKTLPGALDMEYNPSGSTCYGRSKSSMTSWILDFHNTYHSLTGRYPVIYTSTSWWSQCVSGDFSSTVPLWVARYASSAGTLPYKWGFYTFWQYSDSPIDQDLFNGAYDRLQVLAKTP